MAIIVNKTQFNLTGGPNRDSLFDSAKRAFDKIKIPVTFSSAGGNTYRAIITSIEHEDGSGQSFNLRGFIANPAVKNRDEFHIGFKGYFQCHSRTGWMEVICQYATDNTTVTKPESDDCQAITNRLFC